MPATKIGRSILACLDHLRPPLCPVLGLESENEACGIFLHLPNQRSKLLQHPSCLPDNDSLLGRCLDEGIECSTTLVEDGKPGNKRSKSYKVVEGTILRHPTAWRRDPYGQSKGWRFVRRERISMKWTSRVFRSRNTPYTICLTNSVSKAR
jgi:hypothetical protein